MPRSKRAPEKIKAAALRKQAVELRVQGWTFQDIASEIGRSTARAHQLVSEAMAEYRREANELVREEVQMQLLRADGLMQTWMPMARAGDYEAIDKVLKIMDQKAKILGLYYTPKKPPAADQIVIQYITIPADLANDREKWNEFCSMVGTPELGAKYGQETHPVQRERVFTDPALQPH